MNKIHEEEITRQNDKKELREEGGGDGDEAGNVKKEITEGRKREERRVRREKGMERRKIEKEKED